MIEFRALGPAKLDGPEGTEPQAVLARPKLLGLLCFLAAGARGFHRRDSLIGLFWAELDQERARSAVRQSLYRLRRFLGETVVTTRGDDEVALSEVEFWCDVAAFEDALERGDREAALELYRGDLLQGLYVPDAPEFERWIDERRKQLRERASRAAWELADQEARKRNTAAAGHWTRHARDLAPLDERLLRRVIKLLDRLGDRSGAVREYQAFAKRLADELELEPSPETEALIESVRVRSAVSPQPTSEPASQTGPMSGQSLEDALADRYRIRREIGSGGMATVYLARDLRHERDVAVKVMHPELASTLGAQRFLREIKIVAKLTHPHIVPLYDSGLVDGYLFYVMPYIEGESLRERLEREKQLPLEEALEIARDVADALGRAHEIGIVHRDVKPENILVAGGHALVADFGIARAVTVATGSKLTRSGMVVGTPSYISPEQGAGSPEVDGRSDVYSLACVVYEMLGGEPPFTGPTPESIARQHVSVEPRSITELRPAVPKSVAAAISRALAKSPADRFSQVAQFAQALAPSAVRQAVHRSSRRRSLTLLAVTSVLLLVIAAVVGRLSLAPELDTNRVVVLPLENRTADTALALLGSMAADWITQGLQGIDVIEVVPTATGVDPGPDLAGLRGSSGASTARAVGEATGAGTVVAGTYYRRGDSLEFQTQVIDAAGERLLRAGTPVIGAVSAVGAIMDTLRRRVVATVATALDYRLLRSSAASPPPSLDAYRVYLEGHRAFQQVPLRMREALELFYRAVELDSTFTDPRFFIVMAHYNLGELHAADSNAQLLVPLRSRFSPYQQAFLDWLLAGLRGDRSGALQAARSRGALPDVAVEALRSNRPYESVEILSDADPPPRYFHWITLMDALHMTGDYQHELREARRAREVYPDRLRMLGGELRPLAVLGRFDDIASGLDESLLLPSEAGLQAPAVMGAVAAELRAHGYRDESLRVAERAVSWFATRPPEEAGRNLFGHASSLYIAERWDEARSLFEELASAAPRDVNFQGYLGVLAARRGDRDEALRISDRLAGMADPYEFGRDVYWQACIAALLGERDRAMVLLREAYARGRPFTVLLHTDMDLEPLRDYAPFQDFLEPKG